MSQVLLFIFNENYKTNSEEKDYKQKEYNKFFIIIKEYTSKINKEIKLKEKIINIQQEIFSLKNENSNSQSKIKLNDLKNGVSGIYKINFPNGKCYIGLSNDIKRRMYEHNNIRRLDTHFNQPCDLAIRKYGRIEEIEILEKIDENNLLREREQYWIKYYDSNNR